MGGVRTPPAFVWGGGQIGHGHYIIFLFSGLEMYGGGGKAVMDITLSFYTQDIRVLGIRTPH